LRRVADDSQFEQICAFNVSVALNEPTTYKEAITAPDEKHWTAAIKTELEALIENKTWKIVDLPKGHTAIKSRWLFKRKLASDGTIDRYKARLVALGYLQRFGFNFRDTFSPVVRIISIRVILALAVLFDLDVHHMDVCTAFLNGILEDEIYMEIPEGVDIKSTGKRPVCKLLRGLYGLKQSPRIWNKNIHKFLTEIGCTQSKADPCIYIKMSDDGIVIIAVYVDDLLIASSNPNERKQIQQQLMEKYKMKDLGELKWILGMRVTRDPKTRDIKLDQEQYINTILKRFNMDTCKPTSTPAQPGLKLEKEGVGDPSAAAAPYMSAVGSLLYASTGTRPDITYAVGAVSRYMANPKQSHWTAVKRIFRYLRGTSSYGITFRGSDRHGPRIFGYSDSDWGGDKDTCRSTTGYVFKLAGAPISWRSKAQPTVAVSSTEAEYMAACDSAREALWLRQVMADLGFPQSNASIIFEDNQSCIKFTENPVNHTRMKHINIKYHFIKEAVASSALKLKYIPSAQNVADILTKPVSTQTFDRLRIALVA
jgi:hypothetical protein